MHYSNKLFRLWIGFLLSFNTFAFSNYWQNAIAYCLHTELFASHGYQQKNKSDAKFHPVCGEVGQE